ncbi:hypothetical protein FSARC_11624 [Fusarium sarcochroum]|uniref:Clr5 domain-containing protein n=1 Tax=Fusarium sarcochroum TaxID=1208366 RepID=A0A8H4WZ75_9HYPO|nr:hypothetical protein FSARC_11624 [Fusarium sarcochroum]
MSTAKSKPNEEQWMEQKSFIRHEYLFKGTSFKDLASLLVTRGLHTTKAQLEYKLKKWRFSKYLDKETWRSIERKINRRKHQGKDSEVIHCGKRIESSKVMKEICRHRETDILAQFILSTLNQITLREGLKPDATAIFQSSNLASSFSIILKTLSKAERTGALAAAPKLASILANAMPEWYPGEHIQTAHSLTTSPRNELIPDYLKVMIYKMSNGLEVEHAEEWDMLIGPFINALMNHRLDLKDVRSQNITTRAFFDTMFQNEIYWATRPDLPRPHHQSNCLQRPLRIIRWLLESGQDPNLSVRWDSSDSSLMPLGSAIRAGHLDLIQLLIRSNARLNGTQDLFDDEDVVDTVLRSYNPDTVKLRILKLLYRHCKSITLEEMLCIGIKLHDMELVLEMLHQNIDTTKYRTRVMDYSDIRVGHETLLSTAVAAGTDFANVVLNHLSDSNQLAEAVTTDVIIEAAIQGNYETFCRLLEVQSLGDVPNAKGISPLLAAVRYGNLAVCELLLSLHGGASPSLVLLAALCGHEELLPLLIRHGADINASISGDDIVAFPSLYAHLGDHLSLAKGGRASILELLSARSTDLDTEPRSKCLETLIEAGARLTGREVTSFAKHWMVGPLKAALSAGGSPDEQNEHGYTALQVALYTSRYHSRYVEKRFAVVETLLQGGAKLVGGEVVTAIRLQDPDLVALLLRSGGTLRDIDSWGASCLEAEISARNSDFLQEVLEASDDDIDAGPICAAIQIKDWALVDRLCTRRHKETEFHLMEGTAVGLAAGSGNLRVLDKLLARFAHPSTMHSAILPPFLAMKAASEQPPHLKKFTSAFVIVTTGASANIHGFRELLQNGGRADIITLVILAGVENSSEYLEVLSKHQLQIDDFASSAYRIKAPLFYAIRAGDAGLAKWLVEAGSDMNECDPNLAHNRSPLQLAVEMGDLDMVGYLLDKGANINAPPAFQNGATALQCAARNGHLGLANQLLHLGARVNARGARHSGSSALEGAAGHGRLDMIELLLYHGAATTGFGRKQLVTAVGRAKRNTFHAAAEWLQSRCGWAKEDEDLMKRERGQCWPGDCKNCRDFCCDEIHGSWDECINDYSPEAEESYAVKCKECYRLKREKGTLEETQEESQTNSRMSTRKTIERFKEE